MWNCWCLQSSSQATKVLSGDPTAHWPESWTAPTYHSAQRDNSVSDNYTLAGTTELTHCMSHVKTQILPNFKIQISNFKNQNHHLKPLSATSCTLKTLNSAYIIKTTTRASHSYSQIVEKTGFESLSLDMERKSLTFFFLLLIAFASRKILILLLSLLLLWYLMMCFLINFHECV